MKHQLLAPMVFIHGLFGSLSNLGMLARHFQSRQLRFKLMSEIMVYLAILMK